MVKDIFIRLNYGPYEAHGIIRHKIQRLRGLIDYLKEEKYLLELNPTCHLNKLGVVMLDREIFRCDIRNLLFNMPFAEDPVCRRIIDVIKDHERLFFTDRNILRYVNVKEGMRWLEKEHLVSAKEVFSNLISDVETPANSLNITEEQSIQEEIEEKAYVSYGNNDIPVSDEFNEKVGYESNTSSGADSFDEPTVCLGIGCCPPPSVNSEFDEENDTLNFVSSAFDGLEVTDMDE